MKKETKPDTALLRALALQLRAALLHRMEVIEEMSADGV